MKVVWDFGGRRGSSTCLGVCVCVCVCVRFLGGSRALTTTSSFFVIETSRKKPRLTASSPSNTLRNCLPVGHSKQTRHNQMWLQHLQAEMLFHSCIIHQSVINKTSETQRELVYRHTVNRPDSEAAGWPSLDAGAAAAERSASSELSNGNMEEKSRSGETVYWTQNFLIRFQQAGTTWNRPRSAAHLILI